MDEPGRPRFDRQEPRQRARAGDGHRVRVVAERREPPDLDRFVAALLALALAELEDDRPTRAGGNRSVEQSSGR